MYAVGVFGLSQFPQCICHHRWSVSISDALRELQGNCDMVNMWSDQIANPSPDLKL